MGPFRRSSAAAVVEDGRDPSGWLSVASEAPGAIKHALNDSGWLDGEVVAAGELRQGVAPSMAAMVTGTALVEVLRPRRSKSLPRHFVMAVTADRIVVFKTLGGGGGSDAGPYTLRIRAGECGSWPRASIRLLDLLDGDQSKGGTLDIDGTEQLPVSRSNLSGDPDTDELIGVLSGGAAPVREQSERTQRHSEDQQALRRAAELRPAGYRELAADAPRGRPDFDLTGWAERRGLSFRGCTAQGGHLSVTCPWSEDILFNVVRGNWAGGTYGVLCHEARIYDIDTAGFFYGGEVLGDRDSVLGFLRDAIIPLPVGGGSDYFKVPYTTAGSRVPHLATVTGLHVARRAERPTGESGLLTTWSQRPLDDLGLADHWVATVRKHSDEATIERLLRGPIREALSRPQGLGFEIRIEYGQVIVSRQDFLRHDEDLDALVATAETLARGVRDVCVPPAGPLALDTQVQAPEWLAPVRAKPKDKHTLWPIGALLERVVQIADERGMEVQDPRSFHAAFPALNIPGEAFGVMHGRLPGTSLTGRLLCCAERPMNLPEDFAKLLKDPGGAAGSDVVVLAVDPGAPATPPEGIVDGNLRLAIAHGVLTAWRLRPSWQADGEALDQLTADVAAVVRRRGLVG